MSARPGLLLLLLLQVACAGDRDQEEPDLPPNTARFTAKPDLRPAGEGTRRGGYATRLVFTPEGARPEVSAPWQREGEPPPFTLDPRVTYDFVVTWLGWHVDMAQIVEISRDGKHLWRHPAPWIEWPASAVIPSPR